MPRGQDKKFFYLFDYCQNLEYFSQNIPAPEGAVGDSLAKRLFNARVEVIVSLDQRHGEGVATAVSESTGDPQAEEDEMNFRRRLRESNERLEQRPRTAVAAPTASDPVRRDPAAVKPATRLSRLTAGQDQ